MVQAVTAGQANGISSAFDQTAGVTPEERKAFFKAIRAGNTAEVAETLASRPGAACWLEPFKPDDKPYAADDTPLMAAAQARRSDIVKLLLQHGAAPTIDKQNSRGYTALMYAAWQNAEEAAEALLWHGADTFPSCEQGHDAPVLARMRGHDALAKTIERHRDKTEGPAACLNGTAKDVPLISLPAIRRRH